jgi:hypothetical protein
MPTIRCARCGRSVSKPDSGSPPPGWWQLDDANADQQFFSCSTECTAKINAQREAAGFAPWRWWYQEGAEPRDSSRLELAVWLLRAEEEFRSAQQALMNREPEAQGRYAAAKKNLDDAFATSTVILLGQTPGRC